MKKINLPLMGLTIVAISSMGLIGPASASFSLASKVTPKPITLTTSACYKAKLANTALNSVLQDADSVISIANKISSAMPSINSSVYTPTTWGTVHDSLYANAATYAKLMTYVNALSRATQLMDNSSAKALKNVLVAKVSANDKLDANASLNGFISLFNGFPTDDAGVAITVRNVLENTNTLISATDMAFERFYPAAAVSYYTRASLVAGKDLARNNFAQIAADADSALKYNLDSHDLAQVSISTKVSLLDFDQLVSALAALQADANYFLAESQSLIMLAQQVKVSANAALSKLPQC